MNIKEKTLAFISDRLRAPYDKVEASDSLMEDLGADPLDVMYIAVELEDMFDVSITDTELDNIKAPMDLVRMIQTKLNPQELTHA